MKLCCRPYDPANIFRFLYCVYPYLERKEKCRPNHYPMHSGVIEGKAEEHRSTKYFGGTPFSHMIMTTGERIQYVPPNKLAKKCEVYRASDLP